MAGGAGVREIGRPGSRHELGVGALGRARDVAIRGYDRCDGEIQRARSGVQISLKQVLVVLQKPRVLREIVSRQFRVAQQGLALRFPIESR